MICTTEKQYSIVVGEKAGRDPSARGLDSRRFQSQNPRPGVFTQTTQHFLNRTSQCRKTSCHILPFPDLHKALPSSPPPLLAGAQACGGMGLMADLHAHDRDEAPTGNGFSSFSLWRHRRYTKMGSHRGEDGSAGGNGGGDDSSIISSNNYVFACAIFASLNSVLLGYGKMEVLLFSAD